MTTLETIRAHEYARYRDGAPRVTLATTALTFQWFATLSLGTDTVIDLASYRAQIQHNSH